MILTLFLYSTSPPDGYCGDPPGYQYCTFCHTGAPLNPGNGSVYTSNLPPFYNSNSSYDLYVVVRGFGTKKFGFEMIIKDTLNNVLGTFQPLNSNTTVSPSGYVKHLNAPTSNDSFIFAVRWTTPSNYYGKVYIYLVGNVANGNGFNSGDSIYSKIDSLYHSLSIPENNDLIVYKKGNSIFIETKQKIYVDIDFYNIYGSKMKVFSGYINGTKFFKIKSSGIFNIRYKNYRKIIKV